MVVYGDIRHDSRVQREANTLAKVGHDVTIFCTTGSLEEMPLLDDRVAVVARPLAAGAVAPGSPSPFHGPGERSRLMRLADRARWLIGYVRALRAWGRDITVDASRFDVWHANDFAGLAAIAHLLGRDVAVVYDIHDLFVETGSASQLPTPLRRAIRAYERRLVRRVDVTITVNQALAEVIEARLQPSSMIVVHNCAPRWTPPQPAPDLIRVAAGIPLDVPIVLYHGLLGTYRGIENLLEAMLHPRLRRAHLALMGYGPLRPTLEKAIVDPRFDGRVHLLDAVPPSELLPWVASADVGSMAMPRASLNLYLSTPNKLFECLAAGVPVVVSNFPAVREIVTEARGGPLGAACDPASVGDIALALARILDLDPPDRAQLRNRCRTAALERWNWDSEALKLVAAYQALDERRRARATRRSTVPHGDDDRR